MKRLATVLTILALSATACGTTVSTADAPTGSTGLDSGSGLVNGAGATAGGASALSSGNGGLTAPGLGSSSDSSTGVGSTGISSSTGGPPVASGGGTAPGQTSTSPVEVGMVYYPDAGAFFAKFGATANTGDQKADALTAVKWINAHGGLAGHKIKPVFYAVELTSSAPYDQTEQEICASFTQDHHVIAALTIGAAIDNVLPRCLQAHHVLDITGGNFMHDDTDWQQYPYMYSFGEPNTAQVGATMVREILSQGFAKKGDKVGLMVMDEPAGPRIADQVVKPQLAAQGIGVVEYEVPEPTSTPDIGNAVAVDDSAELKMASQGIKTVMFLCPGCMGFFAQNAQSQNYYPRYVFSSLDGPYGLKGSANSTSMRTAFGVGYQPLQDTTDGYTHPASVGANSTRALCGQIEKHSGQITDAVSYYVAILVCDGYLQVWKAAALNPAQPVTGESLIGGLTRFATRWPSSVAFSSDLNASRHFGVTRYRLLHWDLKCSCFLYNSPTTYAFS